MSPGFAKPETMQNESNKSSVTAVHWEWIQELITPALREIPANLDVQIRIRVTKQAMTEEKRTTNGLNVISYQSTEDILSSLDSAESGKSSPRSGQSPADSVSAFQLPITTTSTRFDEEKMEKGLSKVHPECVTWESGRVKAEELLMEIVKKGMECGMNRTVAVSGKQIASSRWCNRLGSIRKLIKSFCEQSVVLRSSRSRSVKLLSEFPTRSPSSREKSLESSSSRRASIGRLLPPLFAKDAAIRFMTIMTESDLAVLFVL